MSDRRRLWKAAIKWRMYSVAVMPVLLAAGWRLGGQESVRWLVTRNPGATDEMRAAAVLMGVHDYSSTEQLPDEGFSEVSFDGVHLAVHASVWTRESFADEFPEAFKEMHHGAVTPDGQVAIDSRSTELPEQIFDHVDDLLYRSQEDRTGSVTEFETR